jgi:hypothetical protein
MSGVTHVASAHTLNVFPFLLARSGVELRALDWWAGLCHLVQPDTWFFSSVTQTRVFFLKFT